MRADITLSFIGRKIGTYTGDGVEYCGDLDFDDLGVPQSIYQRVEPIAECLSLPDELARLSPRSQNSHKGSYGHLLVIGGNDGMGGAPFMTAAAALRTGTGLVSVATHPDHASVFSAAQPELMVRGVSSPSEIEVLIEQCSVIAVGPGLGSSRWSYELLQAALSSGKPIVIDADALNLIAKETQPELLPSRMVMTPHPGEAARLLGIASQEVQSNRAETVNELVQRYGGVQVLKGAGTLIAEDGWMGLCSYGNPGMSSAGMGDVLTGVIAGLLAQGMSPVAAARLGACVHSSAADRLAEQYGQRGLLATDLIPVAREILNGG